ncbi:MAG: GTPase ObgE [Deltaproteobacteria bacterium]|nr:GTPase ObgE [Deltaproteobacteria bacterium]
MKFIDIAKIYVRSGNGGKGCSSMRREKYVEFGGPDGGDGGKGGDIYFMGDASLTTLMDLRLHPHQVAKNGMPGQSKQKFGKKGNDLIIRVPLGTIISDHETGHVYLEILKEEKRLLLKGGLGGLGNIHFKTSTNQAPRYAQPGLPGEELTLKLELKLLADVGLVGFPNAGKSTFISSISNARPKVADYPFTTLIPNLGVVAVASHQSFVVADIPGIIKDAHLGTGLGHQFLRHIQRTSVLALLIDISSMAEKKPMETYEILLNELKNHSVDLQAKKRVVLLTKTDAIESGLNIDRLIEEFRDLNEEVFPISSVSNKGLKKTVTRLFEIIRREKTKSACDK